MVSLREQDSTAEKIIDREVPSFALRLQVWMFEPGGGVLVLHSTELILRWFEGTPGNSGERQMEGHEAYSRES